MSRIAFSTEGRTLDDLIAQEETEVLNGPNMGDFDEYVNSFAATVSSLILKSLA